MKRMKTTIKEKKFLELLLNPQWETMTKIKATKEVPEGKDIKLIKVIDNSVKAKKRAL